MKQQLEQPVCASGVRGGRVEKCTSGRQRFPGIGVVCLGSFPTCPRWGAGGVL